MAGNTYQNAGYISQPTFSAKKEGFMQDVDLVVYGHKMYELMSPYWADIAKNQSGTKAENEFAQTLTAIDKVVFSRSLDSVEGNTSPYPP